ncbi:MAG: hypothetical protein J7619_13015 [Dyadobacter sp.]|uniref:hypothetical protein n=1 Tax=Dyadobacter sp. TaxID=1914288 RepID=UPI001B0F5D4A|nr:hypothetical protein [Dyadobacter sp.]MBO9613615.1 hypothetical protein [Dyadobacter sp.]
MGGLTSFLQVGGFLIAILTIYRALSEFGKTNLLQRAKKLEELIDKFKDKKLYVAKRVLDDFLVVYYEGVESVPPDTPVPRSLSKPVTIVHSKLSTPEWQMLRKGKRSWSFKRDGLKSQTPPRADRRIVGVVRATLPKVDEFTFISLPYLLRNHKTSVIADSEVYFRDSFDELLDFYSLLIYYLRNEIITIREVKAHFQFHLMSVKECGALMEYIRIYYEETDFEWLFKQLPE